MAYVTDRQRIERLLLPQMMLGVLKAGVNDPDHPDAIETERYLVEASAEALLGLPGRDQGKLLRRMVRVHLEITEPFRKKDARVDKVGLLTFYLLKAITDCGYLELHPGSPMDLALGKMLPALEPAANIAKLDKSAQKAAAKALMQLQRLGYFPGVTMSSNESTENAASGAVFEQAAVA